VTTAALPLWSQTLTPLRAGNLHFYKRNERISYTKVKYDPDPENFPEEQKPKQRANETEDEFWDRYNEWEEATRKVVLPEPEEFTPPILPEGEQVVNLAKDYKDRGLQVIVKLANIELTPEKPSYAGGSWHVEGQLVLSFLPTLPLPYANTNYRTSISAPPPSTTMIATILLRAASPSVNNPPPTTPAISPTHNPNTISSPPSSAAPPTQPYKS